MFLFGAILFLAGVWCFFYTFTRCKGYSDAAKSEHDQLTNITAISSLLLMAIGGAICGL
ncbi:MAG: hypothetical protein RR806_07515 [Oscillospiraceae bacterium]